MGSERRLSPRAKVNLEARWEGASTQQEASITDLSLTGCFVLSGGKVEIRELIRLEITLPDRSQIFPWAEVVEEASNIGFAVRFNAMDDEDMGRLQRFVRQALKND